MLEVKNVTKKYGKNLACNDVSFTLDSGSLTVLLGPNGAGKSTIMKSIIGFLKYSGSISVNGIPNKSSEARKVLGYIPEMPSLYSTLTVAEHMEFIARAYKLTNYKERIDMLLKRFELDDKRKKFGDELSKGMQQKLNLCLGPLPDPDIILLDEPLLGLDPHAIKELKNMIEEMRQAGKTLLISTHIIDSVDMLWDRTVIMQNGQVKANVTKSEIDGMGKTLEDLFFEVTEGINRMRNQRTRIRRHKNETFYILCRSYRYQYFEKTFENLGGIFYRDYFGLQPAWHDCKQDSSSCGKQCYGRANGYRRNR